MYVCVYAHASTQRHVHAHAHAHARMFAQTLLEYQDVCSLEFVRVSNHNKPRCRQSIEDTKRVCQDIKHLRLCVCVCVYVAQ